MCRPRSHRAPPFVFFWEPPEFGKLSFLTLSPGLSSWIFFHEPENYFEIIFLSIRQVLNQRRSVYFFVSQQSVYCFISIKLKWKLYPNIKLRTIHLCFIFGENNAFILSADSGELCSAFSALGSNPIQFSASKLSETCCTAHTGR